MSTPTNGVQFGIHAAPTQNLGAIATASRGNNASAAPEARAQRDSISSARTGPSHGVIGILHNIGSSLHALSTWLLDKLLCVLTLGYVRCRPEAGAAATTEGSTNASSAQERLQNLQNIITSGDALHTDKIDAFLAALEVAADDSCDQNAIDNEIRRLFGQMPEEVRNAILQKIWDIRSQHADLDVAVLNANNNFGEEVLNQHTRHPIVRAAANGVLAEYPKAQIREIENQIRNNSLSGAEKALAFNRVFDMQSVPGDLESADIIQEAARLFDVLSSQAADQANAIKQAVSMGMQGIYQQDPNAAQLNGIQFQGGGLQAEDFNNRDFAGIVIRENLSHDFIIRTVRQVILTFELNG
ncbi:MAG: hypothetical protein Tsb0015_13930 [Simkaniaceae bacterium]